MTGISTAVDVCLKIDGLISINPYNSMIDAELTTLVLWQYIRSNKKQITLFGDDSWHSQGNNLSVTFYGVGPKYKYQLKALTLGTEGSPHKSAIA